MKILVPTLALIAGVGTYAVLTSNSPEAPAAAASKFNATLTAPTHTPKINRRWNYKVTATTAKGAPLPARLTVEVIDPLGGAHPVDFRATSTKVVDRQTNGVFRDFLIWPNQAKGFKLTLRATVKTSAGTRVLKYWVKARK